MASNGKKTGGRKQKTTKDEQTTQTVEPDQTSQDVSQSAPVVTDWSKESNKIDEDEFEEVAVSSEQTKSVLDFDRDEIGLFDVGDTAKLSNEDLLKVLVRRGEVQKNPAISAGCKRLLRQINSETSHKPHHQNHSRGRGGFNSRNPRDSEHTSDETNVTHTDSFRPNNNHRNYRVPREMNRPSSQHDETVTDDTTRTDGFRPRNNRVFHDDNNKRTDGYRNTTRYNENTSEETSGGFRGGRQNKYNDKFTSGGNGGGSRGGRGRGYQRSEWQPVSTTV